MPRDHQRGAGLMPGGRKRDLASQGSPVGMTVAWLVADTLQPASYSPLRQTVSVLVGQAAADRRIGTGALVLIGGLQFRAGRWPDWDQRARAARPAAPQARSAARSLALARM